MWNRIVLLGLIFLLCGLAGCAQRHNFVFEERTVTDVNTGLVWTKSANLPGKPLPWKADDNVYAFINKMNQEGFGRYYDWRVPTREELEVLVSYAKNIGFDAEDINTWPYRRLRDLGFQEVQDYDYWTSSRAEPGKLWAVDLARGKAAPAEDGGRYMLWPVRGKKR